MHRCLWAGIVIRVPTALVQGAVKYRNYRGSDLDQIAITSFHLQKSREPESLVCALPCLWGDCRKTMKAHMAAQFEQYSAPPGCVVPLHVRLPGPKLATAHGVAAAV
jgi:hypothetical protein